MRIAHTATKAAFLEMTNDGEVPRNGAPQTLPSPLQIVQVFDTSTTKRQPQVSSSRSKMYPNKMTRSSPSLRSSRGSWVVTVCCCRSLFHVFTPRCCWHAGSVGSAVIPPRFLPRCPCVPLSLINHHNMCSLSAPFPSLHSTLGPLYPRQSSFLGPGKLISSERGPR